MANIDDKCFVLPIETPSYTKVALILKKFSLGEIATDVSPEEFGREQLTFRPQSKYGDHDNVIFTNQQGERNMIVKSTLSDNRFGKSGGIEVVFPRKNCYTDPEKMEKFGPYIKHADALRRNFHLTCDGRINLIKDTDDLRNPNGFLSNLKFFEESLDNLLPLLCSIRTFNLQNKTKVDIKLNEFGRLRTSAHVLDTVDLPQPKSIDMLFRLIANMKKKGVTNCKYGPISISYDVPTKAIHQLITIRFAGIEIVREHAINKFKYLFHPGLNIIAYYLEQQNKVMKMYYSVQKQIIENL